MAARVVDEAHAESGRAGGSVGAKDSSGLLALPQRVDGWLGSEDEVEGLLAPVDQFREFRVL